MTKEIKLGDKVRDKITGFEGIAVARCTYLSGCIQIKVQPPIREGKMAEAEWFDKSQLCDYLNTGGPQTHPPEMHP